MTISDERLARYADAITFAQRCGLIQPSSIASHVMAVADAELAERDAEIQRLRGVETGLKASMASDEQTLARKLAEAWDAGALATAISDQDADLLRRYALPHNPHRKSLSHEATP